MILNTKTVPTIISEGMESTKVNISVKKISQLQSALRDKVYTDKILAPVREICCNAIDEHRKFNIERPVEIGMRYNVDGTCEFYVRDFAKGLSDHDIKNMLYCYIESTKDTSNEANGGFGIGALSPNAYTDTFYTNSYFNGIKTAYVITLDSDEHGLPVGTIINLDSQPTEESGLEVIVPITKGDYHRFAQKIYDFVRFCPSSIVAKIEGEDDLFPKQFSLESIKKDYKFRIYDYSSDNRKNVHYQQGDVIYRSEYSESLRDGKVLVINIPIGRLSLPMSREAFEDTRANQRILEDIKKYIVELEDEDMAVFRNCSVDDLLKDRVEDYFKGQIFTCKKSKIFPNTAQILGDLQKTMFGENTPDFELHEGKVVIGIIPNNKAKDMWRDRLMDYSKEQNKQYWSIVDNPRIQEDVLPQMIKDHFVFKKVKSKFFPLRKAESAGNKMSFVVYEKREHWNTQKDSYTALDLHNHARSKLKLEEAEDLEEAALQMQEQQYPDFKTLNMFTINDRNAYGSRCPYWWTSSQKMREQMKAIGWFILHDAEYTEIFEVLKKIEDKKTEERDLLENCYPRYIDCPVVTKRKIIIPKRLDRARKIKTMLKNMESENSLRGKILKGLSSNYYGPKIDRHELRNILNIRLTTKPVGV